MSCLKHALNYYPSQYAARLFLRFKRCKSMQSTFIYGKNYIVAHQAAGLLCEAVCRVVRKILHKCSVLQAHNHVPLVTNHTQCSHLGAFGTTSTLARQCSVKENTQGKCLFIMAKVKSALNQTLGSACRLQW